MAGIIWTKKTRKRIVFHNFEKTTGSFEEPYAETGL